VMATPYATSLSDVVGIPGRIVQLRDHVKASSCPEFGASRHVASMILTAMTKNPAVRSGMNIRYSTEIIDSCRKLGFSTASYDRRKEPEHLREVEGATIPWGVKSAIESAGLVPDVIYHLGDWGKEPMATVLGSSGTDVVEKALKIVRNLKKTASS
jgi:predicted fused transcriptional regulator/phosphomethylpyrimidine kinase